MKTILAAAGLAALVAVPAQASTLGDVFTSYFAFGDSLTDDGKFAALPPPSAGGRYTNGKTYAEHIADDFAVSENYALGGATAGPFNANVPYPPSNEPVPVDLNIYAHLDAQVDLFEEDVAPAGGGTPSVNPGLDPLVSILMGSNDIFQQAYVNPTYNPMDTVDYVVSAVRRIHAIDAVFDTFIIPLTPGADDAAYGPFRQVYNTYLMGQVGVLRGEGLNVFVPNLDLISDYIDDNLDKFGITKSGSCIPGVIGRNFADPTANNCTYIGTDANGVPMFDLSLANQYALADLVHPTAVVHEAWAEGLVAQVQADMSPVPLPAGALLLVSAFGVLALRRRAA